MKGASVELTTKYVELMRKIAQEEKSDYSEKLLDILQRTLSRVNRAIGTLNPAESKLATSCIGMLTDMVHNGVLAFSAAHKII